VLAIFALVTLGVLSTSVIFGMYKKSVAQGFKALMVITSACGGLVLGAAGFWLLNLIAHGLWKASNVILLGAGVGLLSGAAFGLIAFYVLQWLLAFLKEKLSIN
jgi:hypothetical protein